MAENEKFEFLKGGGEMGALIRSTDWSRTSIGLPDQWPQSLRISVGNLLHSGFPMLLFWGEELLCFYNDAFRPALGKEGRHPSIGQKGNVLWADIWDSIGPLLNDVMVTARPVMFHNQLVPFYRDGKVEDIYWTYSYSPLLNDEFQVGGVMVICIETTSTVQLVKDLVESEDRFKTMAESTDILIAVSDESGRANYFNQAWLNLTGKPAEELIRSGWTDLIHEEEQASFIANHLDALQRREPFKSEFRLRANNGAYHWLLTSGLPRFRTDGSFAGYTSSAVDITERKKAEQEIVDSEARFRSLIEQVPVATGLFTGEDLRIELINQPLLDMFGKGNLPIQQKLLDAVPELALQEFPDILRQVLRTGESYEARSAKAELVRDGIPGTYYFDFSYKPIRNATGEVYAVLDMSVDVTAEVLARKRLEESEAHLELLRNTVPAMIFYLDGEQRYQSCNETFLYWFNVKQSDVLGKTVREFIGESGYAVLEPHLMIAYAGHQEKFEIKAHPQLSIEAWLSIVYTPHITDTGEVIGIIVHVTDVTQSKQVEVVLRESEARFRSLADNSPIFVFIVEPYADARISYWNSTWLQYTGQTAEQAAGRAWDKIIHPDDIELVMQHFADSFQDKTPYYIPAVRVRRRDGVYRWHAFKGNPRYLQDGEFIGYVGVGLDIHEQKISEERLEELVSIRTEELQRSNLELKRSNQNLEDFAYAASHDLKEPVRKMQFFINQLREQLGADLPAKETQSIERIQNAAKRMGLLIDDLLLYSHISQLPYAKESIDLNDKVKWVQEDLELDILEKKARITVGPLPVVNGYRRQLQQLFQNLLSNALKYSKQDLPPEISIHASQVVRDGRSYHLITVADNGIGFEQEYADTIFQIFARLHGQSEYSGTGIGLSIVKKVIDNHEGFIRAESMLDEGSTFFILLPAQA